MADLQQEIFCEYVLVEGASIGPGHFVFCAIHEAAKQDGITIGQVFELRAEGWSWGPYYAMDPTSICDSPFSESEYALLGREGELLRIDGASKKIYKLGHEELPGPLRRVRRCGNSLCVVGEERGAWRFESEEWQKLCLGLPDEMPVGGEIDEDEILERAISDTELAFSIAQGRDGELCMVGTGGEIWFWGRGRWQKDASPTNVNFYDVTYASGERYIVVGQLGMILVGGRGKWTIWESGTNNDLLSVCEFRGRIYVATGNEVMEWQGEELDVVHMGGSVVVPAHQVVSSHGSLLAVGGKEVMVSADGSLWRSMLFLES